MSTPTHPIILEAQIQVPPMKAIIGWLPTTGPPTHLSWLGQPPVELRPKPKKGIVFK